MLFENINIAFEKGVILENAKLEISQITCVLGKSGSGKTSLLKEIAKCLNNKCGFVFQKPILFEHLTIAENLKLVNKDFEKVLAEVELIDCEDLFPRELSGGMQQRVALARAILMNSQILLLDEPFAALDAITRYKMQELLLNLIKDEQIKCLFITHDIDEALKIADKIYILSNQQLSEFITSNNYTIDKLQILELLT